MERIKVVLHTPGKGSAPEPVGVILSPGRLLNLPLLKELFATPPARVQGVVCVCDENGEDRAAIPFDAGGDSKVPFAPGSTVHLWASVVRPRENTNPPESSAAAAAAVNQGGGGGIDRVDRCDPALTQTVLVGGPQDTDECTVLAQNPSKRGRDASGSASRAPPSKRTPTSSRRCAEGSACSGRDGGISEDGDAGDMNVGSGACDSDTDVDDDDDGDADDDDDGDADQGQHAAGSGQQRKCDTHSPARRASPRRAAAARASAPKAGENAQWSFGVKGDKWMPYDEDANAAIEEAFQNGAPWEELSIRGARYRIDLETMVQWRCSDPDRRRAIRREILCKIDLTCVACSKPYAVFLAEREKTDDVLDDLCGACA